jgi:glucose/arabinose dehydrogenase
VLQPGTAAATTFLDIHADVLAGGEQGLLGLAFHPAYAVNRRFFVNYTRQPDGATVMAEYHASIADPDVADTAARTFLVLQHPGFGNHNGGMLEFGSDGFLYISTGDGGSANDPGNRAQNVDDLHGKILRIDVDHVDGPRLYSSPSTNPFVGTAGADEIYALGLRNPWRFSFDRSTGDLYVGHSSSRLPSTGTMGVVAPSPEDTCIGVPKRPFLQGVTCTETFAPAKSSCT